MLPRPTLRLLFCVLSSFLMQYGVFAPFAYPGGNRGTGEARAHNLVASRSKAVDPVEQEVRKLFSEALVLIKVNRAFEARQLLERAAHLMPTDPAIRCNLGLAYQNSGNIGKAIEEFSEALRLKPRMPEATLNMAGCYQSLGQTETAIRWYERYIQENAQAPGIGQIQDIVANLKSAAGKPGSDPRAPDYFESVTADGAYRWPGTSMPIRFFIDGGTGVDGFRPSFRQILIASIDAWIRASRQKISYTLVLSRDEADVVCEWTSNPQDVSEAGTQSERGMARIFAKGNDIRRATLKILTAPVLDQGTLSDDEMKKACLHEIGHILGLQGHSTNNHDVMFFTVDTSTVWPVLSKRDKATMARLYQDYPELTQTTGNVSPPPE